MLEVFFCRHQAGHFGCKYFTVISRSSQIADDLAVAKNTHGDHYKTNAVGQLGNIEAEAGNTGVHIGTDQPHQQAQHDHADRFEQ